MSTYLFVYRHHKDFPAGSPESIAASGAFFKRIQPNLEDLGNPIFTRATVGRCDEDTVLGGYSLVSADSLEEGLALAKECFLLEHDGGVEVGELTRLSDGSLPTSLADHPSVQSTSPKEDTTATTVRALTDALNARDREATVALFAPDSVFRPGAAGASFEGPEAAAEALFGFLDLHKSGQFETLHELYAGDEAYNEWKWVGVTKEGEPFESHGCDYYRIRDRKIALKDTFRKA